MENNILGINLVEIITIIVILLYSFWFAEKKYFNKLLISAINIFTKALRKLYIKEKKHMEDK